MKKIFYIFTILLITLLALSTVSFAATITGIETNVDKNKIAPGETVTINVDFKRDLGSYSVVVDYDPAVFSYLSSEGGEYSDVNSIVTLTYFDRSGGSSPRSTASITFKAKEDLTTSNPSNLLVTFTGMASPDASVTYDDITSPTRKDVLVEPNYVDYTLSLDYTGNIEENVKKDMNLVVASSMGKNYEHVRLLADVTKKPADDATAKLIALKDGAPIDLIQAGWGEETGYSLGGKDVKQELALTGEFSTKGDYTIHVKLIDRDNSDSVIVEKDFNLAVGEKQVTPEQEEPKEEQEQNPEQKPEEKPEVKPEENLPSPYPKTGNTKYIFIALAMLVLIVSYATIVSYEKEK